MPLGMSQLGSGALAASISSLLTEIPSVPAVTGVRVSPSGLSLMGGTTQQFTAEVTGSGGFNPSVTWTTSAGFISSTGLLTLPAAGLEIQNVEVTATSVADFNYKGKATVQVMALGTPDVASIIVAPSRILRTKADDYLVRDGLFSALGDTFYLNQGMWVIDKDVDDSLYYALDLEPVLDNVGTGISSVSCIVQGLTIDIGPLIRGKMIIVKIGGGDPSNSMDAVNSVTFRVICVNGEKFDRSIYFVMKDR